MQGGPFPTPIPFPMPDALDVPTPRTTRVVEEVTTKGGGYGEESGGSGRVTEEVGVKGGECKEGEWRSGPPRRWWRFNGKSKVETTGPSEGS